MEIVKYVTGGICVILGLSSYKIDGTAGNQISNTMLFLFGLTLIFF